MYITIYLAFYRYFVAGSRNVAANGKVVHVADINKTIDMYMYCILFTFSDCSLQIH